MSGGGTREGEDRAPRLPDPTVGDVAGVRERELRLLEPDEGEDGRLRGRLCLRPAARLGARLTPMASMPVRPMHEPAKVPSSARPGEVRRPETEEATPERREPRARRLAEVHSWVLEHHAETFRKLAK